jgi:large subunit ribosomal protein L13
LATTLPNHSALLKSWHVVDAEGLILGRLASRIARILMGKHKPSYVPFLDSGDHVIVVNAEKVVLTGAKEGEKEYIRFSGYPGGITRRSASELRSSRPERLIEEAVRGMLPKSRLGKAQFRKLKVYRGPNHPHQAQKPEKLEVRTRAPRN